ncbi:MAG: SAM-dependent methyltransferase [Aquihabitans sp.]
MSAHWVHVLLLDLNASGGVVSADLERAIIDYIRANGPIGFDEYVGHALYTPGLGFYARGGGAGRRRDFLTSPEVGPLFGAVVARALDAWWDERGQPEQFVVVEAGAGPGTLARTILAARPRCLDALDLILVEPAQTQWETHPDGATSRVDLPAVGELGPGPVVVLANELLDNLPFGQVILADVGWCEVVVRADETADGGPRLAEGYVPLEDRRAAWCRGRAGRDADLGARIPVQAASAEWLADALDLAGAGGRVLVFDYASRSSEMARRPWPEWLRTYAGHGRGHDPLVDPGSCDITVEVAVDQLATVREPDLDRTQAEFLQAHGIDGLVEEGRAVWHARPDGQIDLAAIAARSRIGEAEALLDPTGLGNFRALEWTP